VQLRPLQAAALAVALAGCATPGPPAGGAPSLRLSPASLGRSLALQQHLTVRAAGREQQMDVLLEADPARVKLAVVALGQMAARIEWDGRTLDEWHAPWWPAAVSGARILDDLQLALWPLAAVQAALPPGWQAGDDHDVRTLSEGGAAVAVVRRAGPATIEFEQRRDHYRLTIVSQPADAGAASP
jgi:uncharacterized protein DUF3261